MNIARSNVSGNNCPTLLSPIMMIEVVEFRRSFLRPSRHYNYDYFGLSSISFSELEVELCVFA